jgi:hypothetical protein
MKHVRTIKQCRYLFEMLKDIKKETPFLPDGVRVGFNIGELFRLLGEQMIVYGGTIKAVKYDDPKMKQPAVEYRDRYGEWYFAWYTYEQWGTEYFVYCYGADFETDQESLEFDKDRPERRVW